MKTFINETNSTFALTREERFKKKKAFDSFLSQYRPETNFNKILKDLGTSKSDLIKSGEFLKKLNITLLLNIGVSRLLEYSPVSVQQFSGYLDQSLNLVSCLSEEFDGIEQAISKTAESFFNQIPDTIPKFDWNIDIDQLLFDFFKPFRNSLETLFIATILFVIKPLLNELMKYVDADRINKCVVPCEKDRNPFKNAFSKFILKTGTQTALFFDKKAQESNLQITGKDLENFTQEALKNLSLDEIECLLNGFMSTGIKDILINLFNDMNNASISENRVVELLKNLDNVVEFIPGNENLLPLGPCGDQRFETLDRASLRNQGYSESQINEIVTEKIANNQERLKLIANLFDGIAFNVGSNLESVSNSDITNNIFDRSINATLDSIGKHQQSYVEKSLSNILVNPFGDICLAFYQAQSIANRSSFNLGENQLAFDAQLQEPIPNSITQPIQFSLNNNENFYTRYKSKFSDPPVVSFDYTQNNVKIGIETNGITVQSNSIVVGANNVQVTIPLNQSEELKSFISETSRENAFEAVLLKNNSAVFRNNFNLQLDEEQILSSLYSNFKESVEENLGDSFYFSEFNENPETKKNFSKLKFIDMELLKNQIRNELSE